MQDQCILYRDLKPTNVLFSRAGLALALALALALPESESEPEPDEPEPEPEPWPGRLKLVDFGHAKRLPDWRAERSGSVCGTPHYHAPETHGLGCVGLGCAARP